jgi:tetratricopeptide (TPR) repeat protein
MENYIKRKFLFAFTIILMLVSGCEKFLEEKPDQKLTTINTIQDLQSLLDYDNYILQREPSYGQISADDTYITTESFNSIDYQHEKDMYLWKSTINLDDQGFGNNNWGSVYKLIYTANLILSEVDHIRRTPNDDAAWNNLKGQALLLRGRSFLSLVSIFSLAYDESTADRDLGIALRLDPDFNIPSKRASVRETYAQIVNDLSNASALLPNQSVHVVKPSKATAYALLARTFLWMRKYDDCLKYTNLSLQIKNKLKDYNELSASDDYPFSTLAYTNPEDLLNVVGGWGYSVSGVYGKINPSLYAMYTINDLRKTIFFVENTGTDVGTFKFKGNYAGNNLYYSGIANDEVYLMRAESYARSGNIAAAMKDLNDLLVNRWRKINGVSTYINKTAATKEEALDIILAERRKELVMRNLRWMDIKRLNKEGRNISLSRVIDGKTYTLPANDLRFAIPLPQKDLDFSGMPQNPR